MNWPSTFLKYCIASLIIRKKTYKKNILVFNQNVSSHNKKWGKEALGPTPMGWPKDV